MKRAALLLFGVVTLSLGVSAEAGNRAEITIKPGTTTNFRGIRCRALISRYPVLTCISKGKYTVAVSNTSVIVVRTRDGHTVYHTPY